MDKRPAAVTGIIGMVTLSAIFEELIFNDHDAASPARTKKPAVITFIGSGGKTSLIWLLARSLAKRPQAGAEQRKILVTPTAKMLPPQESENRYDRYCTEPPVDAAPGITLAGMYNEKTGKLESFALPVLEQLSAAYDLVLIEGDGCRGLPLKGWADYEPVVPPFTDITVGIVPLLPLGVPISEKIIHRLPQFCSLCDAQPGEILASTHLAQVIGGNARRPSAYRSLFSAAQGKRALFLNQGEDSGAPERGLEIIKLLPDEFRGSLYRIIVGSVHQNSIC